jgi:hypothetical protein
MIFIIYTISWLACSFFMCLLSFWIGRCSRKLPIIDQNLPWTMSRDQAPHCDGNRKTQDSGCPDPPRWPHSY